MKSRLHVQGTVFKYPYLWLHQRDRERDHPKQRPACLIFELEKSGGKMTLAIVAISDLRSSAKGSCIEVPQVERQRAGLSDFREAYVHVDEYNVVRQSQSWSYDPRTPPLGRFSKTFIMRIAKALAENVRAGRATRIDRD
jgi:hypothetical protein